MKITITSAAFKEGEMIPKLYSCEGKDISPPLAWSGIPAEAKSIALICDDPDAPAGTWVHWVVYDMPPSVKGMDQSVPMGRDLPDGGRQGKSSFGKIGYGGPCPPGGTHRYFFKIYALDKVLSLDAGLTKEQLLKAMEGHIIADGSLMGKYKR